MATWLMPSIAAAVAIGWIMIENGSFQFFNVQFLGRKRV
ncbi:hypothetical protein Rhal01_01332 [Rubritalea halochordaticola]|uniref:Uncharacterized protein n=1 Tax=Rubritalea halochordaticola TaxID=714537 RepID=A0ABP9UZP7_9BACT